MRGASASCDGAAITHGSHRQPNRNAASAIGAAGWAPWLTDDELAEVIAKTRTSNKPWSADQSATVLEIGVRDRSTLHRACLVH